MIGIAAAKRFANRDQSQRMTEIVTVLDKISCQLVEQFRVCGRIRIAQVVDRLDEPASEHGPPKPVYDGATKVGIIVLREPAGKLNAMIAVLVGVDVTLSGQFRYRRLAGSRIGHRAARGQGYLLTSIDLCKDRRQAVVIILGPAVQRMIVTIGALQTCAEKHLADKFRFGAGIE